MKKTIEEQTAGAVIIVLCIGMAAIAASVLTGCGSNLEVLQGPPGPTQTASPSPTPDAVDAIVNSYNEGLVSQGSSPITQGLRCTLYKIANLPTTPCILATSISGCQTVASSTGYTTVGSFIYTGAINQPNESGSVGFNLLPTALQPLYQSNFAVTCTGYVVNTDYNYHSFALTSDDGAVLTVGGTVVANNDGLHSISTVSGEKYLQAQVYSVELQYFQGPGNVALIVNMDGNLLPAENFWH